MIRASPSPQTGDEAERPPQVVSPPRHLAHGTHALSGSSSRPRHPAAVGGRPPPRWGWPAAPEMGSAETRHVPAEVAPPPSRSRPGQDPAKTLLFRHAGPFVTGNEWIYTLFARDPLSLPDDGAQPHPIRAPPGPLVPPARNPRPGAGTGRPIVVERLLFTRIGWILWQGPGHS